MASPIPSRTISLSEQTPFSTTTPEQHYLDLLSTSSRCYQNLQGILQRKPFKYSEIPDFLKNACILKMTTMEFGSNQLLRALTLASDSIPRSTASSSDLSNRLSFLSLETQHQPSYLPFPFYDPTKKSIESAFSYLTTPLETILKESKKLFPNPKEISFSMPNQTSHFFLDYLHGNSPTKIEKRLEQGSCSQIEAWKLGSKVFVLKKLPELSDNSAKQEKFLQIHQKELETEACVYMASSTSHPNVLQLQAYSKDGLHLEHADEDFFSFSSSHQTLFSPQNLLCFFYQMATAIATFHKNDMVHHDFKPENILVVGQKNLKLCDFGFTSHHGANCNYFNGTFYYAPPSKISTFFSESPSKVYPSLKSDDVWSFGVWACECITSFLPFYNSQEIFDIEVEIRKRIFPSQDTSTGPTVCKYQTAICAIAEALAKSDSISDIDIKDRAFSLWAQERIKAHLNLKCTAQDLLSHLSPQNLALLKKRDPLGFFQNLVIHCLDGNDSTRITIEEVLSILKHPPKDYV